MIAVDPADLGVPNELHQTIFEKECELFDSRQRIDSESLPEILAILTSPGLISATDQLLDKNWAIVPFMHTSPFVSRDRDQHWHKDDNGPLNLRRARHHLPIEVEMLYYPQEVKLDMGPTATVPYSQYWTFDSEENNDNFAGADHLDFAYQLGGMEPKSVSGKNSEYSREQIVNGTTAHDKRMRKAVEDLQWPLCQPYEVGPLKAGSVILYSHNMIHRGNHRRDHWSTWQDNPRFMWRFWFYRTTEPRRAKRQVQAPDWQRKPEDPVTGVRLADVSSSVLTTWNYLYSWMGGSPDFHDATASKKSITVLHTQLYAKDDQGEPDRIGAAYQLATLQAKDLPKSIFCKALLSHRENVRRAATFGLIALGESSTDVFLDVLDSPVKWLRKAAVFGLGEVGTTNSDVAEALCKRLLDDDSVYVRSFAASAIGCFVRRAIADANPQLLTTVTQALVQSLTLEQNRLSMDRAQRRSIKFVRPTDACDICEGIGMDFGHDRFRPVRSAVRENVLWSTVILCSHGAAALGDELEPLKEALFYLVQTDQNAFSVGSAMDALYRLAYMGNETTPSDKVLKLRRELADVFASSPITCLDSLSRTYPDLLSNEQEKPTLRLG